MLTKITSAGWFRRLLHGDEEALLAHYRRLSPADRRLRFMHTVSDDFLVRQARRMRDSDYHVTGWFLGGVLRGVAEVAVDGRSAEAGFSVEAPWRNLGVGRKLMRRALRRTRQVACCVLTIYTARDNVAMIRLARRFGARLSSADGDVTGELTPRAASWTEIGLDLLEDRVGLLLHGAEALSVLALANRRFGRTPAAATV